MHIRKQTAPHLTELNTAFIEEFVAIWNTLGLDAARCFAIGA
ncbi:hypothetical protein [Thauera sp.]